jgi:hypothetical protein
VWAARRAGWLLEEGWGRGPGGSEDFYLATSKDHVVTEKLGGVEKIRVCKICNDVVGDGVEARLLSSTSWLTALSQAHGWTAGMVHGKYPDGQRVRTHFGDRTHHMMDPHPSRVERTTPPSNMT